MWPLVLLAAALVFSGIYELFQRRIYNQAVGDYRARILSVLSGLYPEPTNWPKSIDTYLCARLPVMQEIIEEFKPYVPQKDLPAYNRDRAKKISTTRNAMAPNTPQKMPRLRCFSGSRRHASAITIALSPFSTISMAMICSTAIQNCGLAISITEL